MTPATKRRRGRPETKPFPAYGVTEAQIANGHVVLAAPSEVLAMDRPDPDRPMRDANGVQIGWHETKGARVRVAYEHLGLTDPQFRAAKRIHDACEAITGAREFNGGGLGGRAFWQVGGPSAVMVDAAADLRAVAAILGRAHERAVLLLVVNGTVGDLDVLRGALATMAAYWQLD